MKIKAVKKFPRKCMIPGKITIEQYRSLQAGEAAEVDQVSATYLLDRKYAEGKATARGKGAIHAEASKTEKGGDS